tara:strand:- start:898 stop:1626 length:729 start_codon:yes stop_codon:yes gene_type:complete
MDVKTMSAAFGLLCLCSISCSSSISASFGGGSKEPPVTDADADALEEEKQTAIAEAGDDTPSVAELQAQLEKLEVEKETVDTPSVAELQAQLEKLEVKKQTAIAEAGKVDQASAEPTPTPSPIMCQGSWGVCDTVEGGYLNEGFQFYSVTTPAAHGGGACPHKDGAKRECDLPCVDVNEDSIVDLHYKGWGWMGTKLDNPYTTYRGTGVSRNDMWIERCNKCRKGGKFPEDCNNLSPVSYDE